MPVRQSLPPFTPNPASSLALFFRPLFAFASPRFNLTLQIDKGMFPAAQCGSMQAVLPPFAYPCPLSSLAFPLSLSTAPRRWPLHQAPRPWGQRHWYNRQWHTSDAHARRCATAKGISESNQTRTRRLRKASELAELCLRSPQVARPLLRVSRWWTSSRL